MKGFPPKLVCFQKVDLLLKEKHMIHFLCRQHLTQFVTRTKHKQFSIDVTLMLQSLKVKVVTLFYFLIFTTVHTTGMVNVGFLEWVHI